MTAVRELDGADAGGQFVRTALTLAVLQNERVRITNVRGNRRMPGLRHQHLAVLETLAELCDGDVSGAELGAETVEFDPGLETTATASGWARTGRGRLEGGEYAVDIGTAGSATLLFDSLLPLASVLESPLSVTVTGGTDVKWSPPLEYVRRVKLPLCRQAGLTATCEVDRRGFFPNGGGRVTLHVGPADLERIDLVERGGLEGVRLYATESESLADRDVAYRQAEGALERLALADHDLAVTERIEETVASPSPGSALVIRVDHGTGVAGFSALGERGKPAERVGEDAADAANRFLERTGDREPPIDRHMGDQLLVYLALEGGRVRVPAVTDHVVTSCDLLEAFGADVDLEPDAEGEFEDDATRTDDRRAESDGSAVVSVTSTVDG